MNKRIPQMRNDVLPMAGAPSDEEQHWGSDAPYVGAQLRIDAQHIQQAGDDVSPALRGCRGNPARA